MLARANPGSGRSRCWKGPALQRPGVLIASLGGGAWEVKMRKAALLALALVGVLVGAPAASAAPTPTDTSALRNAVTVNGVMKHEKALQQIANANRGTRASGTPGFDASRDYVAGKLR